MCPSLVTLADDSITDWAREFKLSLDDIYEATFALRNFGYPSQAKLGRDLLRACDRSGHAEATLQIASARLRQDIAQPGVLRVTEVLKTLDRLRKLSEQGNMRAVVLEGKLAARRGDEELAISHYERAMDAILENEKEGKDKTSGTRQKWDRRLDDELSSPWIELGFLYMQRKEMTKSLEAYMVGLNQDDPLAYYNLSVLDWHMSDGEPTLNWLFNVTKAAASGHFKAAFELGRYYADSPPHPPPPEDELENSDESMSPETDEEGVSEQPDTDDQRTDNSSATTTPKPEPTFLAKIKHSITKSMLKSTVDLDPKANIAHYAAVAQDPATRVKLSKEWLAVSLGHFYLPAALPLARLHLQQYVWTSHNLTNDLGWLGAESLDTPGVVKNPLYDVWMGAVLLGQVFAAARKIEDARHRAKTNAEFRRLAEPWAEFEEVLESYEAQLDELLDEAKEIADAVGIDVEHDHELMYRHRGERGQGVIECDEETK